MRIILFLAAALCAGPALAQGPVLFIHGPKGCSFFDGLGGDGAAFHALDAEHMILDYWVLEGGELSCQFASEVTLDPVAGQVERAAGTCFTPDAPEFAATFEVVYSEGAATVTADFWDAPKLFLSCPQ